VKEDPSASASSQGFGWQSGALCVAIATATEPDDGSNLRVIHQHQEET
jgi:hypothetical protein